MTFENLGNQMLLYSHQYYETRQDQMHISDYKNIVKNNGLLLEFMPVQTYELCKLAVKQNPSAIQFVNPEYISTKLCRKAVFQDGMTLQFIPKEYQTQEVVKTSICDNPLALQFVIDKNEPICTLAVQIDGEALEFCNEQTEEMCMTAIKNTTIAFQYCKIRSRKVCLYTFSHSTIFERLPKEQQTREICEYALKANTRYWFYVPNKIKKIWQNETKAKKDAVMKELKWSPNIGTNFFNAKRDTMDKMKLVMMELRLLPGIGIEYHELMEHFTKMKDERE